MTNGENERKTKRAHSLKLDWKDVAAIAAAALQTTLLPIVLLLLVIAAISLFATLVLFR